MVDGCVFGRMCLGLSMGIGMIAPAEAGTEFAKALGGRALPGEGIAPYASRVQQAAGFTVEDVAGTSGTRIPITIRLPAPLSSALAQTPGPSFLLFRGLPDAIQLSEGFRIKNSWAVSLKDTGHLELLSPANYRGSHAVEVVLHIGDAATPIRQQFSIKLQPDAGPPDGGSVGSKITGALDAPAARDAVTGGANSASRSGNIGGLPAAKRLGETEAAALLAKGRGLLESGNLASARMLFRELVRQDDARGAFAMGQSYDPEFLKTILVVGLAPDVEAAKHWYGLAAELGSSEAGRRLGVLSGGASR